MTTRQTSHSSIWDRFGRRAVAGDQSAVGGLLELYRPLLLSIANRSLCGSLKTKVGASDLVQQTCEDVIVGITDVQARDGGQFWRWLQSLLSKNVCDVQRRYVLSQKRSVRRETGEIDAAAQSLTVAPVAEQCVMDAEVAEQLHRALLRLPQAHREILTWRFLRSHSCEEIAAVLDRTEGSVRMMVNRALKKLEKELGEKNSETNG